MATPGQVLAQAEARLDLQQRFRIARAQAQRLLDRTKGWSEADHPRVPAGGPDGGQFGEGGGGDGGGAAPSAQAPSSEKPKRSNLSDPEKKVIEFYQGDGFAKINASLRKGNPPGERVKQLDAIIAKFKLSQDFTVFRGVGNTLSKQVEEMWRENKAATFTDKAFVSTSMTKKVAQRFSRNLIEIKLPKGHNVLDIVTENFEHGPEQEILLGRNMKFKVTGFRKVAGFRHIQAELVP